MQYNIAVCSICSRVKSARRGLLQAHKRYLGTHIAKVRKVAARQRRPFFILSSVYGFLPAREGVPPYDHLLVAGEVPALSKKIAAQLKLHKVEEVHFYTKTKTNWAPYREALSNAAAVSGTRLHIHELKEND